MPCRRARSVVWVAGGWGWSMQGRMAQDILGYPWWYVVAGLWTVLGSVWWVGDTIQGLLKHAREVEQFKAEAAERKAAAEAKAAKAS
eukprot:COSAG04_NODE_538_length_12896_cov_41.168243_5_plen_87_part_00